MRRREFISLLGGAVAVWPLAARAQQSAVPVIGFLNSQSPDAFTDVLRGFRQGLREAGFAEGDNVGIEFRWAENQVDRLPALAADLVRRKVAVIAAMDTPSALAAKAETTTITIVFSTGTDPVRDGLVATLARPSGNLTGVSFFAAELAAKRLGLLRELVPGAARIAVLVNPAHVSITEATLRDVEVAARAMGVQVQVLNGSTAREIAAAFATLGDDRPTYFSSAAAHSSMPGASNWLFSRGAMEFPLYTRGGSMLKPED